MTTDRPRIGLLGGTFDPVHVGHLAAARAAEQALRLDQIRFVAAARPPHRPHQPQASVRHRLAMLQVALAESQRPWEVSELELGRSGPSYTFETLQSLRAEGLDALQLYFILGADAFADIATWHRYPDVLDGANFAVVARPGQSVGGLRSRLPELAHRMVPPSAVDGADTSLIVLIETETPAVSSTEVRRRAADGASLEGLVPPAVAAYIAQHSLYQDRAEGIGGHGVSGQKATNN
ncbi:MAG: nicotinate-nucleotide adenylyltransferase [Acidobacteriota bacterium]